MKTSLILLLTLISFSPVSSDGEVVSKNEHVIQLIAELSSPSDPGIQYVIVDKNSVVFEHSFGMADIKNKTPLSLAHTMAAFSMTKTLTAIAVLQLVQRGKIKLDSQASQYVEHPYNSEITIRHLLSHTSGIPNPIPLKWVHLANSHDSFSEVEALSQVLAANPKRDALPGGKYGYSNIGYWLLGGIIEKISDREYSDYINENIFEPLGLTPSEIGFRINNEDNHAKGYLKKYSFMNLIKSFVTDREVWAGYEGGWLHIRNVYANGPAFGGAIGSAKAFSRVLQDLIAENSALLEKNAMRGLYSQQKTNSGENIEMTLGWHVGEISGVKYYYKEGGGAGYHSEMRVYPDLGLASVIMANRTSFNTRKKLSNLDSNFINQ